MVRARGFLETLEAEHDHLSRLARVLCLGSICLVVIVIPELALIGELCSAGLEDVQLAVLGLVIANRAVPLDHLLVAILSLAGVVEVAVFAVSVVDVAVLVAPIGVGDDEHVWSYPGRTDTALPATAVLLVEFGPADRVAGRQL